MGSSKDFGYDQDYLDNPKKWEEQEKREKYLRGQKLARDLEDLKYYLEVEGKTNV